MASGRIDTMDIHELIRLFRAGESDRQIARLVGHNRRTVAHYRTWAADQELLAGELPSVAELHRRLATTVPPPLPPQQVSSVASYAEEIAHLRARGVEIAAIRARLEERHGQPVSYSAVWRWVHRMEPTVPEATVRVEVLPGTEGQVDFGYGGLLLDPTNGQPRRSWVFVLVLSWSRHLYAELVFDQRVETWLLCHIHAFTFFGGYIRNDQEQGRLHGVVQRTHQLKRSMLLCVAAAQSLGTATGGSRRAWGGAMWTAVVIVRCWVAMGRPHSPTPYCDDGDRLLLRRAVRDAPQERERFVSGPHRPSAVAHGAGGAHWSVPSTASA